MKEASGLAADPDIRPPSLQTNCGQCEVVALFETGV
jgi:hypothetical protein